MNDSFFPAVPPGLQNVNSIHGGLNKMKKSLALLLSVFLSVSFALADEKKHEKNEKEKEIVLPMVTESVTVEAKVPKELPFAATAELKLPRIEPIKPKDLAEILPSAPGAYVSTGAKNEWGVKLRGLGTNRITLLYDGIPVYEPYYNSFDLKAIAADQIESVKVVKGASSVLYGPNAMGGIIDVLSKRPADNQFTLRLDYGTRQTYGVYASGAWRGRNLLFTGSASREGSDGFNWVNGGDDRTAPEQRLRAHRPGRQALFLPWPRQPRSWPRSTTSSQNTASPRRPSIYKKQYWRFRDWQRFMANLGGSFPVLNGGYVKARLYYVKHYNILDAYKNDQFSTLQWESTFDNYALGAFVLGMVPLGGKHQLHASASYRDDDVSTQSAVGAPWEHYEHKTLSFGVEDRFRLSEKVELMAGASLDHLNKQDGENKVTLNPLLGVKFNPNDWTDLHLTLSQKSRFPSMKNLYSTCRRTVATPTCATRSAPTSSSASPTTAAGSSAAPSSTTASAT